MDFVGSRYGEDYSQDSEVNRKFGSTRAPYSVLCFSLVCYEFQLYADDLEIIAD